MKVWLNDDLELLMFFPEAGLAKNTKQFPVERMSARFGTFFMTSSFAWMLALAIDEMAPLVNGRPTIAEPGSEISIFGVDMEYGTEYREQRAGVRHFMEIGKQLGISVTRLATGGLIYEPVPYPLWQDDPLLCKLNLRQQETRKHIEETQRAVVYARDQLHTAKGSLAEVDLMLFGSAPPPEGEESTPYDPVVRQTALEKQIKDLEETSNTTKRELVHWQAVDAEQKWLKDYLMP